MQLKTPYSCVIPLKQHTPLIHFQYQQAGATLRATEVKPKLDRFIREELQNCNAALYRQYQQLIEDEIPDRTDDRRMSSYKMRIRGEKVEEYLIASYISKRKKRELEDEGIEYISDTPYFANEKQIKDSAWNDSMLKKGIVSDNIEMELFSFNTDLLVLLDAALPYFFAYNNFGTRQSKGFGSFSTNVSKKEFERLYTHHTDPDELVFFKDERSKKYPILFKSINKEYKILKSGERGEESQMMLYFEDKGLEWEKDTIKLDLIKPRNPAREKDYSQNKRVKYVRALLGLAELYEFPQAGKKVNIKCSDSEIQRFRSPITFKVFGDTIYLLRQELPERIFDKTFEFATKRGSVYINTPKQKSDFDLKEFLENHLDNSWKYVEA